MRSKSVLKIFLLFSSAFLVDASLFSLSAQTTILNYNSAWKYLDNGTDQGTAWRACGFSDGSWASGNGRLGYEDASATCLKNQGVPVVPIIVILRPTTVQNILPTISGTPLPSPGCPAIATLPSTWSVTMVRSFMSMAWKYGGIICLPVRSVIRRLPVPP